MLDLIVEEGVVVELKAIRGIERVHEAQLLSYLRLTRLNVDLLLNFNVEMLCEGVRRSVNDY